MTNKRSPTGQITRHYRRVEQANLAWRRKVLHEKQQAKSALQSMPNDIPIMPIPNLNKTNDSGDTDLRFNISNSTDHPVDIYLLAQNTNKDPAFTVTIP